MPPRSNRSSLQRTLSNNSNSSSSSSSASKPKLKQNKLDFSFHSTTTAAATSARPFGSRPLSSTPSFGLPIAATAPAATRQQQQRAASPLPPAPQKSTIATGKQKQQDITAQVDDEDLYNQADSLWSERLAPISAEELAVHPKKVTQVRTWLEEAFSSNPSLLRHRKLLALTGPAGAGKSATIRALAADLDFDLLEWQNDQPFFDANTPASSFIERFTDFLSKAAKFPTLDFQHEDAQGSTTTLDTANRRRAILLEDLPNLHHLPTKQLFQASLQHHIQQSTQLTSRGFPNVPIILIVTESTPREDQDRWAGDAGTTWKDRIASIMDTRTALGETIRKSPAYTEVRFNPVAPTIVLKGLKRAMEQSGRGGKVWLELLQAIAEDSNGDLRAAVNCLQFVGVKGLGEGVKLKGEEGRRRVRRLIPLVSGRESSLALFHALGKVLYNKREGDAGDEAGRGTRFVAEDDSDDETRSDTEKMRLQERLKAAMRSIIPPSDDDDELVQTLPDHLSHLCRRTSRVHPDQLWADLPVDSSVFQLYLHQNFPQFTTEVEECESILEEFSTADALMPLHEGYRFSTLSAYYGFLISVQGTLMGLPSPVKRQGQKLGKATWWDVQKKLRGIMQDVEDVKSSSTRITGSIEREDSTATRLKRTKFQPQLPATTDDMDRSDAGLGYASIDTLLMRSDTMTLVTEVLPLLAKIKPDAFEGKAGEVTRMRFEYAGVADMADRTLGEHESGVVDEEEGEGGVEKGSSGDKRGVKRKVGDGGVDVGVEEQLILSDDDIGDF
ncbi:Checkpoint protein RAD24 [Pseudozyma hubeiensis]|nr:Checkpoint protein RAD24 [Pseudozyma hubeiensis]